MDLCQTFFGDGGETADMPQCYHSALILSTPGVLLPHSPLSTQVSSSLHLLLPGHSEAGQVVQEHLLLIQVMALEIFPFL